MNEADIVKRKESLRTIVYELSQLWRPSVRNMLTGGEGMQET